MEVSMMMSHYRNLLDATADHVSEGNKQEVMFVAGFDDQGRFPAAVGVDADIEDGPVLYPFPLIDFEDVETYTILTFENGQQRAKFLTNGANQNHFVLWGSGPSIPSDPGPNPAGQLSVDDEQDVTGQAAGGLVFALAFFKPLNPANPNVPARSAKVWRGSNPNTVYRRNVPRNMSGSLVRIETFSVLSVRRNPYCKVYQYPDGSRVHFHVP
jgi:hypothetical protein